MSVLNATLMSSLPMNMSAVKLPPVGSVVSSAVAAAQPTSAIAMVLRRPRSSIPASATNSAGSSPALVMRMFLKSSEVRPITEDDGGGGGGGGREKVRTITA